MRATLTTRALDAAKLIAELSSPERGATACFIGTVRDSNDGREVEGIDYRAYEEMAEAEMNRILAEAADQFIGVDIVAEHRIGQLDVGDASVVVVTAHAHRGPALDCLRHVVEEIKSRLTIWKLEHYEDGAREWVNAAPNATDDRNAIA
jgi:molybdopterin synthase catalytic subunit